MPSPSRRQMLLEEVRSRLEKITGGPSFETDAGKRLYFGEIPAGGEDDEPNTAIAWSLGDDTPVFQQGKVMQSLPIVVMALARFDRADPMVAVEQVLADIQRAIELPDRRLNGLVSHELIVGPTQTLETEEGAITGGVAITYVAQYERSWGNP